MPITQRNDRSLLRRTKSIAVTIQSAFDTLVVIALIMAHSLTLHNGITLPYVLMTLVLLGSMAFFYDRFDIYRSYDGLSKKTWQLAKAWGLSFLALLVIGFLSKQTDVFSRIFVLSLFFSGYLLQVAVRFFVRYLFNLGTRHNPNAHALVIGTGNLTDTLHERINKNPWLSQRVIGAVEIPGTEPEVNTTGYPSTPIIGKLNDLSSLLQEHDIEAVYIAAPLENSEVVKEIYFNLLDFNLDVHWIPNIFALNLINHSITEIAGLPILTLSETPLVGSDLLLKNVEDKAIASLALLLLSPLMLITALMIRLESKGPIFFRQSRTGWDGKEFQIWKFRSMHVEPLEKNGTVKQATRDDPRFTRVGRFIRKTSIDELPQLFNVVSGKMSLVGPRPHAVQHNREYSTRITAYLARHRIKPGITGLAQVRGYRGETKKLSQMEKRVECDLEYINNWSIWLDVTIMFRTLFIFFGKNVY